jgi:membrane fusion protein (multidrug efflux system)
MRFGWLMVLALGCGHPPPEAPAQSGGDEGKPPVEVKRVTAEARDVPVVRTWMGTLVAERSARLAADANGVVTSVHVDRGDRVSSGDLLVEVDPRVAQLQASASDAQVALTRAQLEAAELECARAETLLAGGAMATAAAERARAACEAQQKALELAQSQAKIASTQVAKAKVRAPFSGVVAERMVEVGEFVGAASPVVTLMVLDPIRVRFPVPERDLGGLREGDELQVRVPALGAAPVLGKVMPLPPSAREQTRDVMVEAQLPNPDGALRAGLSGYVDAVLSRQPAVVVPASAVLADDTTHRLYRIQGEVVEELLVHTADAGDGMLAVSPGVNAGDVVVDAPQGLRDGSRVR